MFNQFDHFYIGFISLFFSKTGLFILFISAIAFKTAFLRKTPVIFNIFVLSVMIGSFFIFHLNFSKNKCKEIFSLTLEQCEFNFTNQPESPYDEQFLYFEIKRNEKPELNGYILGKDKSSFEIKQKSYYVLIRPSIQFKDNDSLLFFEKEKSNVLDKVNDFLDNGDKL